MSDARAIRLKIEKLVAGGDGLAFHEGRAVFVPLALPGETVEVRLRESHRDFAKAELLGLGETSPERVEPICPIYASCGGCNLQHLAYPAQLEAKARILGEAFRRVGGLDPGGLVVHPSPPFGYRNRLQLHVGPDGRLGFMRRSGNELVEAPGCPVAVEELGAWIGALARQGGAAERDPAAPALAAKAAETGPGAARRGAGGDEAAAMARNAATAAELAPNAPGAGDARSGARAGNSPLGVARSGAERSAAAWLGVARSAASRGTPPPLTASGDDGDPSRFVVFGAGGRVWVGRGEAMVEVLGEPIRFRVEGFFQSNLRMLESLIPRLLDGLAGDRAADLYCGVGLFSRFLGRQFGELVCVEREGPSLALARVNVPGGPGRRREFAAQAVEDWIRSLPAGGRPGRFDCVVVDPPRAGLSASVRAWMIRARIPALRYVSCDPVTLARDVGELVRSGYVLESVEGFDFYPQTSHLESLARLSWRG